MGYKMARNKKLFTEMVLIKLSYLQQAIELQQSEPGLSKKKGASETRPVAFRSLTVKEVKEVPAKESKKPVAPARLIIEAPAAAPVKKIVDPVVSPVSEPPAGNEPKATLGSLKKIREKLVQRDNLPGTGSVPITAESLKEAWKEYIGLLKAKKNHSSVTIFNMAELSVVDSNSFMIHTGNAMQQKFIEVERPGLIEHLMTRFNNRAVSYQIVISESVQEENPSEKPLNTKEKYQQMIEQYPNIKLLKERIRLELDY
jgi:DNA polymerase-3 subunit gamma/tau